MRKRRQSFWQNIFQLMCLNLLAYNQNIKRCIYVIFCDCFKQKNITGIPPQGAVEFSFCWTYFSFKGPLKEGQRSYSVKERSGEGCLLQLWLFFLLFCQHQVLLGCYYILQQNEKKITILLFKQVSFRKMYMKMKWKTLVSSVPEGVLGNVQRRSTNIHMAAAS